MKYLIQIRPSPDFGYNWQIIALGPTNLRLGGGWERNLKNVRTMAQRAYRFAVNRPVWIRVGSRLNPIYRTHPDQHYSVGLSAEARGNDGYWRWKFYRGNDILCFGETPDWKEVQRTVEQIWRNTPAAWETLTQYDYDEAEAWEYADTDTEQPGE